MRLTYSACFAGVVGAVLALAAMKPALASYVPAVPEPSSLTTFGAGTLVLVAIVCARVITLKRRTPKLDP